jgi:hypothetical protein
MYHSMTDPAVLHSLWRVRPPTGQTLRHALAALMTTEEAETELARACNRSIGYVRWHLGSDAVVPACLLAAALRLGAHAGEPAFPVPRTTLR